MNIVQIGFDDSVFDKAAPSDTKLRQKRYGDELNHILPGSKLYLLSITNRYHARAITCGNVIFYPVHVKRRFLIAFAIFITIIRIHRVNPIGVITTQTPFDECWGSLIFGLFWHVPVVAQIHFDFFSSFAIEDNAGKGWVGKTRYFLASKLLPMCAYVRVVGKRVERQIGEHGLHSRVAVIPVPVSIQFAQDQVKDVIPPQHMVLFVGRLVRQKNLESWLRVAQKVSALKPDADFTIIGEGPLKTTLMQVADRLGIASQITFTGPVPNDQLTGFYQSASVLLLTSHYEGFGRVAVEAIACGTPVVGPKICGLEDIIEEGVSGFLLDPGDEQGMADAIVSLLNDPIRRMRLGAAGRQIVSEKFDAQTLVHNWINLLIDVGKRKIK